MCSERIIVITGYSMVTRVVPVVRVLAVVTFSRSSDYSSY